MSSTYNYNYSTANHNHHSTFWLHRSRRFRMGWYLSLLTDYPCDDHHMNYYLDYYPNNFDVGDVLQEDPANLLKYTMIDPSWSWRIFDILKLSTWLHLGTKWRCPHWRRSKHYNIRATQDHARNTFTHNKLIIIINSEMMTRQRKK